MGDPEVWQWIWVVGALAFAVGEMVTPGSFIALPFAIGCALAGLLAVADVPVAIQLLAFLVGSVGTLLAFRPLSRRLDSQGVDDGIGARRLLGQEATVITEIPGNGNLGLVRVDREEWRAESTDGTPIPSGTPVRVADVRGTRVVVSPRDALPPSTEQAGS
jgi:membrane protein implicated in regulation of membrane protease activity